jgi:adenylate cyclase class 2
VSEAPTLERELKFPVPNLDELREKLIEFEAERVGPSALEDNLVFDRGGELRKAKCILRLRMESHGSRLTFKGPPTYENRVKVRVENETRAEDPKALHKILESLGYEVVHRYQKYREEWRLGGVVVALDHTPIGDYAEFEGDRAERVAGRCGFDAESSEQRNYLRLYEDYRASHPDAPADMIFP